LQEKFVYGEKVDHHGLESFVLRNSKLKLPWSDCELKKAISHC